MTVSAKVSLHGFLAAFVLIVWLFGNPALTLFAGGVCATIIYGTLTIVECLDSPGLITPYSYHFAWNTAALGIAAIYAAAMIWTTGWTQFLPIRYVGANNLASGYLLCVIASLLIHCTLRATAPNEAGATKRPGNAPGTARIVPWALGAMMFVAGGIVIMAPPGAMALSGLPAAIARFSPLAILLAVAFGPMQRRFYWTKLITGTAFLVAANLLAFFPYKGGVIQSLFPLMIAFWKRSKRLTMVAAVLVPLFYLGIVAPYVTASRSKTKLNPLERLSAIDTQTDDAHRFDALMKRLFEPIGAGFIVGEARFHGYLKGETLKNVEYAFVPRFLWPDKPNMSSGNWFTAYLGFGELETSTAMTPAGELYWNFSVPGMVFGIVLLGCLYGLLWRVAEHFGKGTFLGALLYFYVILYPTSAGDATSMFVLIPSLLVLLAPVLFWSKMKAAGRWFFGPLMKPEPGAPAPRI